VRSGHSKPEAKKQKGKSYSRFNPAPVKQKASFSNITKKITGIFSLLPAQGFFIESISSHH